jgi:protein transport protein SEC61 subunit gamma-like protein
MDEDNQKQPELENQAGEPKVEVAKRVEPSQPEQHKEEEHKKMELPKVNLPSIEMPNFKLPKLSEIPSKMKSKLREYARVLKITKKPSKQEFISVLKITGLGTILIGAIGFLIFIIITYLEKL